MKMTVGLILQTRIPQIMARDRVAWTASSTGVYTVKTGYQYWSSQNISEANNMGSDNSSSWNRIWKLNLPHKMRTFLWRFCNNNIPVRNLLRGKGVATTIICPMCNTDVEHMLHIFFFDCKFATDCWEKVGLWFDMQTAETASSWLLERIKVESSAIVEKIAIVLLSIWFARNQKIWENKIVTPVIAVEVGVKQVKDWQEAMVRRAKINSLANRPVMQMPITWQPPSAGCYKMNVDASVFKGESSFSIGMVLRDDHGHFVKGKNMCFSGEVTVMEAEARAVQEAISWIEELRLHGVSIESDAQLVVKAINDHSEYYLEVGHTLESCKMKLKNRPDLSLCHVKKHINRAAHLLARVECMVECYNVFESPPNVLLETILAEVS